MLAGQTPFVVDMQDGLFINSFGAPMDPLGKTKYPESIAGLRRLMAEWQWSAEDRQQAVTTLRSLQELSVCAD